MIHAITTYFNPCQYRLRLENYHKFRERFERHNVPLITVEVSPNGRFQTDSQIRIVAKTFLWQKERLFNLALEKIPLCYDKIAWIDADVILSNEWEEETEQLLDDHDLVQLFQYVHMHNEWNDGDCLVEGLASIKTRGLQVNAASGFAWAGRRDWICRFYEKAILGGADLIISMAAFRNYDYLRQWPDSWSPDLLAWIEGRAPARVSFVPGIIRHLRHGKRAHRKYVERHRLLDQYNIHPDDIFVNNQGIMDVHNKDFVNAAMKYFYSRKEDDGVISFL